MKHIPYRIFPAVMVFTLTWYLSSIPGLQSDFMPVVDFTLRKGAHMAIFMLQYLTIFYALLPRHLSKISESEWTELHIHTTIWSLLLALSDEWHQAFVPGRTAIPMDIVYDALGFLFAYCVLFVIWNGLRCSKKLH